MISEGINTRSEGGGGEGAVQLLFPPPCCLFCRGSVCTQGEEREQSSPPFPSSLAVILLQSIFCGRDNQRGRFLVDDLVLGGPRVEILSTEDRKGVVHRAKWHVHYGVILEDKLIAE